MTATGQPVRIETTASIARDNPRLDQRGGDPDYQVLEVFYLAPILDLHSRQCVGFAMGAHHDARLATAALQVAIAVRGGTVGGVIIHTDQGGEYTGEPFARAGRRHPVDGADRIGAGQRGRRLDR